MRCAKVKKKIIFHFYGELSPGEEASLKKHLEKCTACRKNYSEIKTVWQALQEVSFKSPLNGLSPAFWEESWQAIERDIRESQFRISATKLGKRIFNPRSLVWAIPLILIMALASFFLYRIIPKFSGFSEASLSSKPMATSLEEYKTDLKPLLLMLTNFQSEKEEFILIDKKYAQQLLLENKLLRSYLWQKDPIAAEWLADLEIVLKEISYSHKIDPVTLEMIKKMIQEKKVFLEINKLSPR